MIYIKSNITKVLKSVIKHNAKQSSIYQQSTFLKIKIPISSKLNQISHVKQLFTKFKTEKCKCSQVNQITTYICQNSTNLFPEIKTPIRTKYKNIKIDKTNIFTSNLNIENLNIISEMYILQPSQKSDQEKIRQTTCYKIFSQPSKTSYTLNNCKINLVMEKTYNSSQIKNSKIITCDNRIGWDNYDKLYLQFQYLPNVKTLFESDTILLKIINLLSNMIINLTSGTLDKDKQCRKLSISGGSNYTIDYITSQISKICMSDKNSHWKFSNLFNETVMLNNSIYFSEILKNIDKYYVSKGFSGIEYIIVVDSVKNMMYLINGNFITGSRKIETKPTNINNGFCVLSAVKNNNKFIIKYIIIDNNNYCNSPNSSLALNKINSLNKKYGDLLECEYITYDTLSKSNYKKCIKKYIKKIDDNEMDFIEFSNKKFNTLNTLKRYIWSYKKSPITFYCRKCPVAYLEYLSNKVDNSEKLGKRGNNSDSKMLYLLFLTGTDVMVRNSLPYNDPKLKGLYMELFGDLSTTSPNSRPMYASMSTLPNSYLFYSDIPDLNKEYASLVVDKYPVLQFIQKNNKLDTGMYGDSYKYTELNIWNSYRNPMDLITILDKTEVGNQMYFMDKKHNMHKAPIKFNNSVKHFLIKMAQNQKAIIDLATGRGSDLLTYYYNNIRNILFVEIDKDAIDELISRKYFMGAIPSYFTNDKAKKYKPINKNVNWKKNNFRKHYQSPDPPHFSNILQTSVSIINDNLNKPCKKLITKIAEEYDTFSNGVSYIYCFFALHYMCGNLKNIKNIVSLINTLLAKGGKFIYTSFDETAVVNLLKKNNGKWTVHSNGVKKYEIISKYKPSDKHKKIELILPFNAPTYYYKEELINDRMLDDEFSKYGIKVIQEENFLSQLPLFKEHSQKKNHNLYNMLTDDDKIFSSLYKYKVYEKHKI
jgi:hypothetical protein